MQSRQCRAAPWHCQGIVSVASSLAQFPRSNTVVYLLQTDSSMSLHGGGANAVTAWGICCLSWVAVKLWVGGSWVLCACSCVKVSG